MTLAVLVTATWRGGHVVPNRPRGEDEVLFATRDAGLAEREGHHGDQYSGWQGAARIAELTDVDVVRLDTRPAQGAHHADAPRPMAISCRSTPRPGGTV